MSNNPPCPHLNANAFSLSLCKACELKVNCGQFTAMYTGINPQGEIQLALWPSPLSGGWNEEPAHGARRRRTNMAHSGSVGDTLSHSGGKTAAFKGRAATSG
jgi:hypothetical protein